MRRRKIKGSQEGKLESSCIQKSEIDKLPLLKHKNEKSVHPWFRTKLINSACNNNLILNHYCRIDKLYQDSPFAVFNRKLEIPSYTYQDYDDYLKRDDWTLDETDHLFDLARRFNLKFIVMNDRWDRETFHPRSIEDLKDRYYSCVSILSKHKSGPGLSEEMKYYVFDKKHEEARKKQLELLWSRTPEQVAEENWLREEYERIIKERKQKKEEQRKVLRFMRRSNRFERSPTRNSQDLSLFDEFENISYTNSSRKIRRTKRNLKKSFRKSLEETESDDEITDEIEVEENERKTGGKVPPKNYSSKTNIEITDVEKEILKSENSAFEHNKNEAQVEKKSGSQQSMKELKTLQADCQENVLSSKIVDVESEILKEKKSLDFEKSEKREETPQKSQESQQREKPKISQNLNEQELSNETEIKNENHQAKSMNPLIDEKIQSELHVEKSTSMKENEMTEQTEIPQDVELKEVNASDDTLKEILSEPKNTKKMYSSLRKLVADTSLEMTRQNAQKKRKSFDAFLNSLNDNKPLPYKDVCQQLTALSSDIFDAMQNKREFDNLEVELRNLEKDFNMCYPSKSFPWSYVFEAVEGDFYIEPETSFLPSSEMVSIQKEAMSRSSLHAMHNKESKKQTTQDSKYSEPVRLSKYKRQRKRASFRSKKND